MNYKPLLITIMLSRIAIDCALYGVGGARTNNDMGAGGITANSETDGNASRATYALIGMDLENPNYHKPSFVSDEGRILLRDSVDIYVNKLWNLKDGYETTSVTTSLQEYGFPSGIAIFDMNRHGDVVGHFRYLTDYVAPVEYVLSPCSGQNEVNAEAHIGTEIVIVPLYGSAGDSELSISTTRKHTRQYLISDGSYTIEGYHPVDYPDGRLLVASDNGKAYGWGYKNQTGWVKLHWGYSESICYGNELPTYTSYEKYGSFNLTNAAWADIPNSPESFTPFKIEIDNNDPEYETYLWSQELAMAGTTIKPIDAAGDYVLMEAYQYSHTEQTSQSYGCVLTSPDTVKFYDGDATSVNEHGQVVASNYLHTGDISVTFPNDLIGLTSPASEEPLILLDQTGIHIQKTDEAGTLVPITNIDSFVSYALEDIIPNWENQPWELMNPTAISANGAFIIGRGRYYPDGVTTDGSGNKVFNNSSNYASKHFILFGISHNPVFGEGPQGTGTCSTFGGGGSGSASANCTFVDTDVDKIDPDGAINQVINPAGIVIESNPNSSNTAIFKVETKATDEQANEYLYWVIESEGGNATFYPNSDEHRNKGHSVMINGVTEGRVRISIRLGAEDGQEIEFIEALVVTKKTIPYRVNLLTYENNSDEVLPHPTLEVPKIMNVANIILRQAGIELVASTDDSVGNLDNVLNQSESEVFFINGVFKVKTNNRSLVEEVSIGWREDAMSINYIPNVFQVNFIETFDDAAIGGFNLFHTQNSLPGTSVSAAYRTSVNDTFNEAMLHTLNFDSYFPSPDYSNMWGFLVSWKTQNNPAIQRAGGTVAHEATHLMGLQHRTGTNDWTNDYDGLETQQNGKLLGANGTNLMDYGSGVDIDLLQVKIIRGSSLLQ